MGTRERRFYSRRSNGFKIVAPVRVTSAVVFGVTRVNPCTLAVAASHPSMIGRGSGTLRRAQASAIGFVDRQHAVPEPRPHLREPAIQGRRLFDVMASSEFDAATDFGQDHDARPHIPHGGSRYPIRDARIGAVSLADFGNDVGIEQELQRSISRQPFWRG